MSDIDKKYFIKECPHCGNTTILHVIAEHCEKSQNSDFLWANKWLILKCAVCHHISVATLYTGDDCVDCDGNDHDVFTIKYPDSSYKGTNVPQEIDEAFNIARQIYHKDSAICIVALRRTLEFICHDKKATGNNLSSKIRNLAKTGVLPNTLKMSSDLIRELGNKSAHEYGAKIDKSIAKKLIEFTQKIIEYIYVIPYQIQELTKNSPK